MKSPLLGGLSPRRFLRDYWQKKPLLIRHAIPGFSGLIERDELFRLAGQEDVESRLVSQTRQGWRLLHGPFTAAQFGKLPKRQWTLLVQALNHFLPDAAELLQRFSFIPHARVDDVMASFAVAGGGVGAHVDSYDVFLLQGPGQRRWQISAQPDHDLVADAPLRLLSDFRPEQEWLLEAGDMLYLPPNSAHFGVAVNDCMTYSIGFRAPSHQELAQAFLSHLQDQLALSGCYADPDLAPTDQPGRLPLDLVSDAAGALQRIRWSDRDVGDFLGAYLSEPKPHVFFDARPSPLSLARFVAGLESHGIALAGKSRMLYHGETFYLNGERYRAAGSAKKFLRCLADQRLIPPHAKPDAPTLAQLYDWYQAGFIELNRRKPRKSP